MYQQWRDLLFLHWEYNPIAIQKTLPDGLTVDAFGAKAYLGIVPFFMRNIRPRFLPSVPGISNFMELNVRTYVHDRSGVPGVWFYSLDANQWLAVTLARHLFHLPYEHARMTASRSADGAIHYESTRVAGRAKGETSTFDYAARFELPQPQVGSLEFFLVERYRLYAATPRGLRCGAVFHEPYPLCEAAVTSWDERLLATNGFALTGRAPDHVVMSRGVDVTVFPLAQTAFSE
jgi:hypothetical protein